jgi:predicted nucleic acid-binding Zn ribbon protein
MDFLSASDRAEMSLIEGKPVRPSPKPESDLWDHGDVRPPSRCPFCNSALTIADQAGVCRECGRAIREMDLEKGLEDDEILASQNDRAGAYLLLAFIIGLVILGFIVG